MENNFQLTFGGVALWKKIQLVYHLPGDEGL
jgi:hypothetical protein